MQQAEQRQSYSQFLGFQIPTNCVILQLEPNNASAEQVAAFIMEPKFIEEIKSYGAEVRAIPAGGKVYLLVQSPAINEALQSIGSEVVVEGQGDSANELGIQLISDSEFNTFFNETHKKFYATDIMKSLYFEAQLVKTKGLGMLLRNILTKFFPDQESILNVYDKLRSLNLDLRFASSSTLPFVLREKGASEAVKSGDYLKFMQLG